MVTADVYAVPPHVGRGGWTWYTGSVGLDAARRARVGARPAHARRARASCCGPACPTPGRATASRYRVPDGARATRFACAATGGLAAPASCGCALDGEAAGSGGRRRGLADRARTARSTRSRSSSALSSGARPRRAARGAPARGGPRRAPGGRRRATARRGRARGETSTKPPGGRQAPPKLTRTPVRAVGAELEVERAEVRRQAARTHARRLRAPTPRAPRRRARAGPRRRARSEQAPHAAHEARRHPAVRQIAEEARRARVARRDLGPLAPARQGAGRRSATRAARARAPSSRAGGAPPRCGSRRACTRRGGCSPRRRASSSCQ